MNYEFYIFILIILRCQGQEWRRQFVYLLLDFFFFAIVSEIIGLERGVSVAPVATDTQEPD